MDNFLTLSPELIATGKVTREQLTNLIYKDFKKFMNVVYYYNHLTKLEYY